MNFPVQPTSFEKNPYEIEWFERDFFHSGDGVKEFPRHHCKKTFYTSFPFIKSFRNALDIGCRDGEYSRYLQHYFSHTYSFDSRIRRTFPYNVDLQKTTHFNCAVGDERTTIKMYGGTHDPSHALGYEIECHTIDSFNFSDVDYIKIDVEGYEKKVILGALKTIEKHRPLIVVEQNAVTLPGEAPFAAKNLLESLGYEHVATCDRGWDYVMAPK